MIKRPINPRFPDKVLSGQKTTTIREKPWPIGVPIMLYRWNGKPYASKHINVAVIIVTATTPIVIEHLPSGQLLYDYEGVKGTVALWFTEGFEDGRDIDEWFRPLVKRGQKIEQHLMTFKLTLRTP